MATDLALDAVFLLRGNASLDLLHRFTLCGAGPSSETLIGPIFDISRRRVQRRCPHGMGSISGPGQTECVFLGAPNS